MELQKINQLLDQYWKGELSESEEDALKKALLEQEPDLEGDLKETAEWFKQNEAYKDSIQLSDDFDQKIMDKIHAKSETKDQWSWWKIAAAAMIIFSLAYTAWFIPQQQNKAELADNTAENPMKAYEETKATLALMASMMNSGKSQLESLELFEKAQEKIKNNLESKNNKKDKNS